MPLAFCRAIKAPARIRKKKATETTMNVSSSVDSKASATVNTKAGATFKDVIDECLAKAKQQAEDDNPPCIPNVPLDSDEEENEEDVTNKSNLSASAALKMDKTNVTTHKTDSARPKEGEGGGQATVRLMTAEEALCLYMGLKQTESAQQAFYAVLGKCTEVIKQKIKEYQLTAVYVFPAPLLFHDREYLLEFLTEQLHFTVTSS